VKAEGGLRRLPRPVAAKQPEPQSRFDCGRDARHDAYRAALDRLNELESALDTLALLEPRGEHLASAAWLAAERLRRHHLDPHRHFVREWGIAA
jgi:hypothetical protein